MQPPPARATLDIRRQTRTCAACGHRFSPEAAFCPFDGTKLDSTTYDPTRDPLIGRTIDGRYEVLTLLGEGGMGQVYEVRHVALDRRFAMKVLRRELAREEDLAARFIDEAKATAAVRHPNVVQITDFGKLETGAPYFVMELLVGETLGRIIKAGGAIPAARAVRIIQQVAGALAAAHAAGVVHRDLKPENVFLVGGVTGGLASADVRVVDFGAAKIIGSSRITKQGVVFGTPHYMSPEQASGQPVDHRADIYSLGVIMYEMFTGRVPFEADTYMGVLTQHMFVQPVPPSKVSAAAKELGAIEDITLVCLAKKPEERYATMQELLDALAEVVRPGEDGGPESSPRSSRRPSRIPSGMRYRMADELEPPTLAEMRGAIDSLLPPRRVVPWGWIAALTGVMAAAAITWAVVERTGRHAPAVQVAPIPAVSTAITAIPPPPPLVSASATVPVSAPASSSPPGPAAPPTGKKAPPRAPPAMDDVADPFAGRH